MTDHRKQSLYFPAALLEELTDEARRLDRSLSWVVKYALTHGGLASVRALPSIPRVAP